MSIESGSKNALNNIDNKSIIEAEADQDLNTSNSPTFSGVTLSGLTASKLVETNSSSVLQSVTDLNPFFTAGTNITFSGTDVLTINSTAGGGVFGSEFQQASFDASSTTSSTTFVQVLKMSIGTVPSGTYRVGWSVEIEQSTTDGGQYRVQENDTTDLGFGFNDSSVGPEKIDMGGFKYLTAYTGGTDIDIDIKVFVGGTTKVENTRLEFWRVS